MVPWVSSYLQDLLDPYISVQIYQSHGRRGRGFTSSLLPSMVGHATLSTPSGELARLQLWD